MSKSFSRVFPGQQAVAKSCRLDSHDSRGFSRASGDIYRIFEFQIDKNRIGLLWHLCAITALAPPPANNFSAKSALAAARRQVLLGSEDDERWRAVAPGEDLSDWCLPSTPSVRAWNYRADWDASGCLRGDATGWVNEIGGWRMCLCTCVCVGRWWEVKKKRIDYMRGGGNVRTIVRMREKDRKVYERDREDARRARKRDVIY